VVELLDFGLKAMRSAEKLDADQIEVFLADTKMLTMRMERGTIKSAHSLTDSGASVRVFWKKHSAMSYTTSLNQDDIVNSIKTAISAAKAGRIDPNFTSLPEPKPLPKVVGLYDTNVDSFSIEDATCMLMDAAKAAKIDEKIYSLNVFLGVGSQRVAVVNSLGVMCEDKCTSLGVSVNVVAKVGDDMSSGSESKFSRIIKNVNPDGVGKKAAEHAIRSLNAKTISTTATLPVVLDPKAAAVIVGGALTAPLNAENIQRGRSYLCGKMGREIGYDKFTVIDDGTLPEGILSLGFDAEGVPSQRKMLIENGVLKNYIYDSYTAGIEKRDSTGNAVRISGGMGFADYRRPPYISTRNLIIPEVKGSSEDFISEIREGIWLCETDDLPNIATGEFSGLMAEAYKIEKGEITYPIKQATIGINMLDFFKNIEAIGSDSRQIVAHGIDGIVRNTFIPSIMVKAARIAG